jgi:hypothetical protein
MKGYQKLPLGPQDSHGNAINEVQYSEEAEKGPFSEESSITACACCSSWQYPLSTLPCGRYVTSVS